MDRESLTWESLIRATYNLFLKYKNYRTVTKEINDKYFPSFLSAPLTYHQVKGILRNSIYAGTAQFADKVSVEDLSLAYVDKETYERVQNIAKSIRGTHSHKKNVLEDFIREPYFLDATMESIPYLAVLCPKCAKSGNNVIMEKNGSRPLGSLEAHNYLCMKCGKQRKVPTIEDVEKIFSWALRLNNLMQSQKLD